MQYNYQKNFLKRGTKIVVSLNQQAFVLLMDPLNYMRFKNGDNYRYHGGLAQMSPCKIIVPHTGEWYLVLHLGGNAGYLEYSVDFI